LLNDIGADFSAPIPFAQHYPLRFYYTVDNFVSDWEIRCFYDDAIRRLYRFNYSQAYGQKGRAGETAAALSFIYSASY